MSNIFKLLCVVGIHCYHWDGKHETMFKTHKLGNFSCTKRKELIDKYEGRLNHCCRCNKTKLTNLRMLWMA